jgi:hypothetical protein
MDSFFRCVFSSPESERTAHVRAWNASDAVQLFRSELLSDGVEERGTIRVSSFSDDEARRAPYRGSASESQRL